MAFFKILIVGLISDIDNVVILSALLSKHYFKGIQLYTILLLSVSRTAFVYTLGKFINLPGFHLVTGMVILWLSLRLAFYEPLPSKKRTTQSKRQIGQTLLLLLGTDFLLSMDSLITISQISKNLTFIFFGLLVGLTILLFYFPVIFKLIQTFPWVTLFIGSFMAHIGTQTLMREPMVHKKVYAINLMYPGLRIDNLVVDFSMLFILLLGLIFKLTASNRTMPD